MALMTALLDADDDNITIAQESALLGSGPILYINADIVCFARESTYIKFKTFKFNVLLN